MKRAMLGLLAAGAACELDGMCVRDDVGPVVDAVTGEAWYTEATGFFGLFWGSKVFYCPAPTAAGPATCKEAKLVPLPERSSPACSAHAARDWTIATRRRACCIVPSGLELLES